MLLAVPARAHIGSPDTFVQATIGPYAVLIALHPPSTTPGALELDLRFDPADRLRAATSSLDDGPSTPVHLVLDGTAAASLWSPSAGAHTLHISVQGARGAGSYSVVLPAASQPATRTVAGLVPLAVALALLAAFLAVSWWRGRPLLASRRAARLVALTVLLAGCVLAALVARPRQPAQTTLTATLHDDRLDLTLHNPQAPIFDLVADHGKMLHLFLVREPRKDVFLHLHPSEVLTPMPAGALLAPSPHTARFTVALPPMPPGTYTLFADFYHANGVNETSTLRLSLPAQSHGGLCDPDDTTAVLPPLVSATDATLRTAHLPDGYTIQLRTPAQLMPLHAVLLEAKLLDPAGEPPPDMALYLGMNAHAVVLRADDRVFAHIHPGGTLPMLAGGGMTMAMPTGPAANTATIPFGFPSAGLYRVFVQMKHGTRVETAAFDLSVH